MYYMSLPESVLDEITSTSKCLLLPETFAEPNALKTSKQRSELYVSPDLTKFWAKYMRLNMGMPGFRPCDDAIGM